MREIKLNDNIIGDEKRKHFFAIKNEKGLYIHYTHHSRWSDRLCNARLFNSERGAIDEATRMLEHKKFESEGKYGSFSKGFGKTFDKVFVVELELKEVE
ncbi:MAG: hypothetical protein IKP60_13895 [Treponema sp.]|nr:hypothetical protein [Treponema sp.]